MSKPIISQAQWIHDYNATVREVFNDDLFERDNYEIIEALKRVILSCQRDKYFTIKVTNFTVVEDYTQIHQILFDYEQEKIDRNKNNSRKVENPHQYINLRDTDMMLLIVDYYISINNPDKFAEDTLRVIIEVPRIVDKYYYKIGGNYFTAIYQIVDGSTYNNTSSNSKKQSVTFKTVFMPTIIYRNTGEETDDNGCPMKFTTYVSRIFNKNVPVVEYFLAKFGLYGALEFMGLFGAVIVTPEDDMIVDDDSMYHLTANGITISTPKVLFDQDLIVQSATITLFRHISSTKSFKNCTFDDIKDVNHWLRSLADRFNSKSTEEKGLSILDSLESIYDIDTHMDLRLPEEDKANIYGVLRWMIREFPALRLKDNADISTKKLRRPGSYIASMYGAKVSTGIYRASDSHKEITIDAIKRYIRVEPSFLIDAIVKDKLVSFRDAVNDNDAFTALKFSFKGRSGLGEQANSTIPDSYRQLHPSVLTRTDPDTSSATDPGLTGIICPLANVYNGSFAPKEYQEPNEWDDTFTELMNNYYNLRAKKQFIVFQNQCDGVFDNSTSKEEMDILEYCMEQQKNALTAMNEVDNGTEYLAGSVTEDGTFIIWD